MDIQKAKQLALALIKKHGLEKDGWAFKLDKARRRFGLCDNSERIISISKVLSEINTEKAVRNVILHEIAHALVGARFRHGIVWKRKALEIGCDGRPRYNANKVKTLPKKWIAICPNCGKKSYSERKHNVSCGKCSKTYNPKYLLKWELNKKKYV